MGSPVKPGYGGATPRGGGRASEDSVGVAELEFDAAVAFVKDQIASTRQGVTREAMLALYALYKQATEGPSSGRRPTFLEPVARAKYDAWRELDGMAAPEARGAYVKLVQSLAPDFHPGDLYPPSAPESPEAGSGVDFTTRFGGGTLDHSETAEFDILSPSSLPPFSPTAPRSEIPALASPRTTPPAPPVEVDLEGESLRALEYADCLSFLPSAASLDGDDRCNGAALPSFERSFDPGTPSSSGGGSAFRSPTKVENGSPGVAGGFFGFLTSPGAAALTEPSPARSSRTSTPDSTPGWRTAEHQTPSQSSPGRGAASSLTPQCLTDPRLAAAVQALGLTGDTPSAALSPRNLHQEEDSEAAFEDAVSILQSIGSAESLAGFRTGLAADANLHNETVSSLLSTVQRLETQVEQLQQRVEQAEQEVDTVKTWAVPVVAFAVAAPAAIMLAVRLWRGPEPRNARNHHLSRR